MVEKFEFGRFNLEIFNDETFSKNSIDNNHMYDNEYKSGMYSNTLISKYGVKVLKDQKLVRSVILMAEGGGMTHIHNKFFLMDGENLIIIIGDSIFNLHLPDTSLNWCLKCDDSLCFNLYKITNGYIMHGELSITKISESGTIDWQFYGRDIFVTEDGANNFKIEDDRIVVCDWGNYTYHIDFYGKEIK